MPAHILVIEDNPPNLELMNYLLQAFGHKTTVAMDGEEGLTALQASTPDLILCDIQLPRVDGYEVAKRVKSHPVQRRIPLVAVTAYAMVGDRDRILTAGFDGYIPKPIVPESFIGQVDAFLRSDQRTSFTPPAQETAELTGPPIKPMAYQATLLVVDNSAVNRSIARSSLESFGYRIVEATSVQEALKLANEVHPELILSDLHMPLESGFDLLHAVRADMNLKATPFVIISSTVWKEQDKAEGLAFGVNSFVLRPIEPEALLIEINRVLKIDQEK